MLQNKARHRIVARLSPPSVGHAAIAAGEPAGERAVLPVLVELNGTERDAVLVWAAGMQRQAA
jgi:hypothetical protein